MKRDFEQSFKDALQAFDTLIRPRLYGVMGGDFLSCEARGRRGDEIARALDTQAGIDVLHVGRYGLRGLSLRIQEGPKVYRTFTLRKSRDSGARTEVEKLSRAVKYDYIRPHWTLQAYVNEGQLLAFALATTADLLRCLDGGFYHESRTGEGQIGGSGFLIIPWGDMQAINMEVHVYDPYKGQVKKAA